MYRYIEPEYLWTCPEDGKKFPDPHYKCRDCEHFARFHTDNISGLDTVIGCRFPQIPENQTLIHQIATSKDKVQE